MVPGSQEFRVRLFFFFVIYLKEPWFIGASVMEIFVAKYALCSEGVLLCEESVFYISN